MTTTGWAGAIIIIIILAGGAWFFMSQPQPQPAPQTPTNTTQTTTTDSGTTAAEQSGTDAGMPDTGTVSGGGSVAVEVVASQPKTITVTYGSGGFSPNTVTINKGDKVTFSNQGGGSMWVAADQHPTHASYDGTDRSAHCGTGAAKSFDQCSVGTSYSFTFDKTGSFSYHNHSAAQFSGAVIVK